ncbi:MAG: RES family NAD+ phosphorylase [Pseudomonadota bacterium]
MEVYRIAKTSHIKDLTGTGARMAGGRWNRKGTAILYTSESRSLAAMEYLVHVPFSLMPDDLSIACIEITDSIQPDRISADALPKGWREYPAPSALADLGTDWARENHSLMLRVPSAVVQGEFNILINPLHPEMLQVAVTKIERFSFDERLVRRNLNLR